VTHWADHLTILPVILPLVASTVMLLIDERHHSIKAAINIATILVLTGVAIALLHLTDAQPVPVRVYHLGDWPAQFGIVLVADRLSTLMLALTCLLALTSAVFSLSRWHRAGPHFHSLFQFLLMGLNGAFLTGDLFNLFRLLRTAVGGVLWSRAAWIGHCSRQGGPALHRSQSCRLVAVSDRCEPDLWRDRYAEHGRPRRPDSASARGGQDAA
jgi:hypothetical protein